MRKLSALPLFPTSSDTRAATLQTLLIAVIVIGALYLGREILLPLALAILLSFILTPPLLVLRRIKVPRVVAVGIVVLTAFGVLFALGWLLSREATQLAADLPSYRYTLSQKIKSFRESTTKSSTLERAGEVLTELEKELATEEPPPAPKVGSEAQRPQDRPIEVQIAEPEPTIWEVYQDLAGALLPPLATAGIVLLFVVFIMLQREDLRDRLLRLAGASDLQRATTTINEAASSLSRYFLILTTINALYGAFIALALWLIGIPSPIVWGVLAGLMRYVPFIGSYVAAAFPVILAAAVDPGWQTVLVTLSVFVVSELTMGYVVEPLVFGRGTGLSPIAVVVAAIFWTWIWGPLGLLLAMPITLCIAVLGRNVEGLGFLAVMLGDEPALTPEERFYQRALSGDADEATYQAELCLEGQSLENCLETIVLPGLKLAERDARRGLLDDHQSAKVTETVKEMLDNLSDYEPGRWFSQLPLRAMDEKEETGLASLTAAEINDEEESPVVERSELAPGWVVDEPILSIGGRTALDEAAAAVLGEILKKRGLGAKVLEPGATSAAHIATLADTEAKIICLCYLGLGAGAASTRYLVRRLRRILPQGTRILVCYWAENGELAASKEMLQTAADGYAFSLSEAVEFCVKAAKGELFSDVTETHSIPHHTVDLDRTADAGRGR